MSKRVYHLAYYVHFTQFYIEGNQSIAYLLHVKEILVPTSIL